MDGKNEVRCRVEGGKVQELIREIRAEHRALVGQLIAVEAAGATGRPVPDEAKGALAGAVAHMEQEEAELYPALEPYVGTGTVTMTLRAEHAAIREALQGLDEGGHRLRVSRPMSRGACGTTSRVRRRRSLT